MFLVNHVFSPLVYVTNSLFHCLFFFSTRRVIFSTPPSLSDYDFNFYGYGEYQGGYADSYYDDYYSHYEDYYDYGYGAGSHSRELMGTRAGTERVGEAMRDIVVLLSCRIFPSNSHYKEFHAG